MRLVPRHRRRRREGIAARIAISQADIDADVTFRGEQRPGASAAAPARGRR